MTVNCFSRIVWGVLWVFFFTAFYSCGSEKEPETLSELNVRIAADPERINPMLSRSGYATQIEGQIFFPLFSQDPETLDFVPMLAEGEPEVEEGFDFDGTPGTGFTYSIREEARWSDGTPVTAEDYLFSVKMALNPYVPATSWKGFLQFLLDVELRPDNDRVFTAYANSDYMHAMEITSSFALYPRHFYDPEGLMENFEYTELRDYEEGVFPEERESTLKKAADEFTLARYSREVVEGAGPYSLTAYESGRRISLSKKENWWGEGLFPAEPERINYLIIGDETVALSALKEGSIHIMAEVSPKNFNELQSDPVQSEKFRFYTPPLLQIYYLAINNENPKFDDADTRRALAKMIDLDFVIEELLEGYAEAVPSVLHPADPFYNPHLKPLQYSIEKADSLLKVAGWEDSDNNGIPDRIRNGEKTELRIDFDVSSGELGQQIAVLFKESAEKLGIPVNINRREFRLIRQDMHNKNYDISPLVLRQNLLRTDLYQNWHSHSNRPGGNNVAGYSNPEADELIAQIRTERDEDRLEELYHRVQEIIYKDQPVVFLVAPQERLVVSNKIDLTVSALRPGYFERSARMKE